MPQKCYFYYVWVEFSVTVYNEQKYEGSKYVPYVCKDYALLMVRGMLGSLY